jgi:hypothetical protein
MVGSLDAFPKALDLIKAQSVEGKIVLYPQIPSMELLRVRNWKRCDETDFLKACGKP